MIERLQPGDIVFFDADPDDNCNRSASVIDHVGIYLGQDDVDPAVPGRRPRPRFISSRKTVNGPTTHDVGGPSALDGDTHFGRGFVAARRF